MVELLDQSLSLLLVIAGTILVVAEALAPGAHFIVLGVALLVAGLIGLALGSLIAPALMPFILAALVLGVGGAALWAYRNLDIYGGKGSGQTSDSASLKGQTGRVTEEVTKTSGEVKLDAGGFNPYYAARSVHGVIPEGTEIMVVDPGGGNVITVESMEFVEDDIDRELAKGRREAERVENESESDVV